MTDFLIRIVELSKFGLAGSELVTCLLAEFGGRTIYLPSTSELLRKAYPDLREIAAQALDTAFRLEMEEVMRGAVSARPEHHPEWLARAQHSVEQHLSAKHWIEHFSAPAASHTAQSSAA